MSKKVYYFTALAVCCALALAPVIAAERTDDRSADRVQRGADRTNSDSDVGAEVGDGESLPAGGELRVRVPSQSQLNVGAAMELLAQAKKLWETGQDATAQAILARIQQMEFAADAPGLEDMMVGVYDTLAGMYPDGSPKQVAHLNGALSHASGADAKQAYRDRIIAAGGVVVADAPMLAPTASTVTTRVAGAGDDTCETALPAVLPVEVQDISFPGDGNWRFVEVTNEFGSLTTVETFANAGTDIPDTAVWVYGSPCPASLDDFIAFNDDKDPDAGDFMSLVDAGCLSAGTYYVEIRGWCPENVGTGHCSDPTNEYVVGSFDVEISFEECPLELPADNYEPDDVPEMASSIGHPSSTPEHANSWGRAKRDIQKHTIGNSDDIDWVEFKLTRTELVRVGVMGQYPTFFNDFTAVPLEIPGQEDPEDGVDRQVYYEVPVDGFPVNSSGCPDPGPPCTYVERFGAPPIVAQQTSSERTANNFTVCLPNTRNANTSASVIEGIDWTVSVNGVGTRDIFEYELQVKNETPCAFEVEPNDLTGEANALTLGQTVSGFYDFNISAPFQDQDLYDFDVEQTSAVIIETTAPNGRQSDTFIALFVGPLGPPFEPVFLATGLTSEDAGGSFLSRIDIPALPPAEDLLDAFGLPPGEDARYLLQVTSNYFNSNFPYNVETTVVPLPVPEIEPNDFSEAGSNWMSINSGQVIDAEIITGCDLDTYKIALVESTYVKIQTAAGTLSDTVLEMVDCDNGAVIANTCNDDGGIGLASRLEGCLGVGDHCFRTRAFSGSATGSYEFTIQEQGTGCPAMDPPSINSSGSNIGCSANSCL